MKTFVGIDLGSTTTKAVLLDENCEVIGRGITNSRSNYATAARVASEEARIDGRFTLFRRALNAGGGLVRREVEVQLRQPGASAQVDGAYLVDGERHSDTTILIDHQSPSLTSAPLC